MLHFEGKAIYVLTAEDAQDVAEDQYNLDRPLTDDELIEIADGVARQLGDYWYETVHMAIESVLETKKEN